MALTRSFRETVKARAERDPAFRVGLLEGAVEAMLRGVFFEGKILRRYFVNATCGFAALA
jgi:hypothetical protein